MVAPAAPVGPPAPVSAELDESHRDLAVLLGAFVSEGWVGQRRAGFNNVDRDYFDEVLAAYERTADLFEYLFETKAQLQK